MKIKRSKREKKGRIEIIPMIDVMFFLLVTFMLASVTMQHINGVAVNLEKGKADKIKVEEKIVLSIKEDGKVFLNQDQIAIDELALALQEILKDTDANIIINSDRQARQGIVMKAMIEAKKAGAKHFSLISKYE